MPYAITETGWRSIEVDWPLTGGEICVDEIPQSLVDKIVKAEIVCQNLEVLLSKQQKANEVISPLQAGVDIDEISEEELSRWRSWKRYFIALSNTPTRAGWPSDPDWPVVPD
ncbi:Caudovirales tail fiber assembly protein [Pseudomonas sp. GM79]|uniref:tail fiber assembly protein n=1 Tax=Pseudomonas sp. GM79 TaxID=1144338 RepID=UPI00026F7CA4|nr:tail fiber assembly protein [Pseudomonas sp. GM79]EJN17219.1 Caudovirales tail fiber assembly protein [Pseudomonas sp. GM79]